MPGSAREKPVPMGSMKTRSVAGSQESGLATSLPGGGGGGGRGGALSPMTTFRRPTAPRCSQTEYEPGPPLTTKLIGRVAGSVLGSMRV